MLKDQCLEKQLLSFILEKNPNKTATYVLQKKLKKFARCCRKKVETFDTRKKVYFDDICFCHVGTFLVEAGTWFDRYSVVVEAYKTKTHLKEE